MAHPYPGLPLPAGPHRRGISGNERFGLLRTAPVLQRRVGLPVRGTVTLIDSRFAHISGDEKNVRFSNRQLRPTFIPPLTSEIRLSAFYAYSAVVLQSRLKTNH